MKRFKIWLMEKFLPAWAKIEAAEEEEKLKKKILELETENKQLKSYIAGMTDAIRKQRKIIINTGDKT